MYTHLIQSGVIFALLSLPYAGIGTWSSKYCDTYCKYEFCIRTTYFNCFEDGIINI